MGKSGELGSGIIFALVLEMAALLPGCSAARFTASTSHEGWYVGISNPTVLLEYRDNAGAAAYCKRSQLLLEEMVSKVSAENGHTGCVAQRTRDLSGADVVDVQCPVTEVVNGCRDVYRAMVWGESLPTSTTHYDLVSLGWVVRRCSSIDTTIRRPDAIVTYVVGVSRRVTDFLEQCKARDDLHASRLQQAAGRGPGRGVAFTDF